MRSINMKGKVGGAILAFSLVLGFGIMSCTTAQAQWQRRDDRYGIKFCFYNNAYHDALYDGYQAGVNTGASDAQRGQSYSPQRSRYYRNASTQAYRDGFVRGYDEGFRQYGGSRRSNTGSNIGTILGAILGRP